MGARVLIIEDTPHNLELMGYLLKARGHVVTGTITGAEGLAAAVQQRPDLIVMDMQLPDIDGQEALARIRNDLALLHTPVVAVTAYAMVGDRERILASGFQGYMTKPIEPASFAETVESFLPQNLKGQAPPRRPPAPEVPKQQPHPQQVAVAKILVIDDLRMNIELARRLLEAHRYAVFAATSAEEALALARIAPPDLMLCDVHLAGESGWSILETVRRDDQLAHIPFAFLSATDPYEDKPPDVPEDSYSFIHRPISPLDLLRKIDVLLGRSNDKHLEHEEPRRETEETESPHELREIVHELNNVLSAILNYATFIRDELDHENRARNDAIQIIDAVKRGVTLMDELADPAGEGLHNVRS